MAIIIQNIELANLNDDGSIQKQTIHPTTIHISNEPDNLLIRIKQIESLLNNQFSELKIFKTSDTARYGKQAYLISNDETGFIIYFNSVHDLKFFMQIIDDFKSSNKKSVFAQRTDESSASSYFQFYGYLSQQQNMMQDYIRTSTYQKAIISNLSDFKDKVVLDVGAGSGILSFFATQAGAKKVYAVEASSMAKYAEKLVENNKLTDKITVIPGKIEEINLPEMVDVIVSEPMGYMLFNERMLETYLHAKKFLKPNGKMYPTKGDLHFAPFTDLALYIEQINKSNFWYQQSFHGVDLSCLRDAAVKEYFKQPIVDTFDISICMAKSQCYSVDFLTADEHDLHNIDIPFEFKINQNGEVHGLAFWFDVAFLGTDKSVWLSTSPTEPLSHWYQVLALLEQPVFVYKDQLLVGRVRLVSNKRQSYDVEIEVENSATGVKSSNVLDLKNPCFHYTGQPVRQAPGTYTESPSTLLWTQLDQNQQQQQQQQTQQQPQQLTVQQPQLVAINTLTDNVMNCVVNGNGNSVINLPNDLQPTQQIQQPDTISSLTMQPLAPHQNSQLNYSNQSNTNLVIENTDLMNSNLLNANNLNRQGHLSNSSKPQNGTSNGYSVNQIYNTSTFPMNNNLLIGDYAANGNLVVGQNNIIFKQ